MNEESQIDDFAPWFAVIITLIGAGLRVLLLDHKGMWLDETFSVWLANHSVPEMLRWIVQIDQHPPLYYFLLHFWMERFGDTPYYVRLLSVLFGAATIPIIFLIGRRMSGAVMGLAAAVFLAFSPFNIRFAQDARMYTLLAFNAAMAVYALVRLLTDPRSARPFGAQFRDYWRAWRTAAPVEPDPNAHFSYKNQSRGRTQLGAWLARHRLLPLRAIETDLAWVTFIVFSAATLLTHNTAVLYIIAVNIFVLGLILVRRKKDPQQAPGFQAPPLGNWIKAHIAIFLLWSPWLPAFLRQTNRVYQEFWIPKPDWPVVLRTLKALVNEQTPGHDSPAVIMWIMFALVLGLGIVHFRKRMSKFVFLAVLFAVPFLGELIVSIRRPIFLDRTLIWLTIPVLLLLAAGVAQLRFRFLMIAGAGILAAVNLFTASDYFRFAQTEDWSNPAGYVANFAQEGDLVLFNASWVQIPFDYYFRSYEDQYSIQVEKHGVPVDMFDSGILEPKMTDADIPGLAALLDGRERVWLVYSHNWYTDPAGIIPRTLASKMILTRQRDFYGVQVQYYQAP